MLGKVEALEAGLVGELCKVQAILEDPLRGRPWDVLDVVEDAEGGSHAANLTVWRIRGAVARVGEGASSSTHLDRGVFMSAAALPLAIAGTGYGLIGLLVIIVLVLLIWRLI